MLSILQLPPCKRRYLMWNSGICIVHETWWILCTRLSHLHRTLSIYAVVHYHIATFLAIWILKISMNENSWSNLFVLDLASLYEYIFELNFRRYSNHIKIHRVCLFIRIYTLPSISFITIYLTSQEFLNCIGIPSASVQNKHSLNMRLLTAYRHYS